MRIWIHIVQKKQCVHTVLRQQKGDLSAFSVYSAALSSQRNSLFAVVFNLIYVLKEV